LGNIISNLNDCNVKNYLLLSWGGVIFKKQGNNEWTKPVRMQSDGELLLNNLWKKSSLLFDLFW